MECGKIMHVRRGIMELIEKNTNCEESIEDRQVEKTRIYDEILKGQFHKAEELFLNSSHQEEEEFFCLYLRILYGQNRVEEMFQLVKNAKHKDSILIQREYVKYLYLLKDYDTILSIYEIQKDRQDPKIFCYYVRIISKIKGIPAALSLIEESCLKGNIYVEALKIQLLRINGSLNEALTLCETSTNREEYKIVVEEIHLLSKLGKYQEAYQKAMNSGYQEYLIVKTNVIFILCRWYLAGKKKNKQLLELAQMHIDQSLLSIDKKYFCAYMFFLTVSGRYEERQLLMKEDGFGEEIKQEKNILSKQLGAICCGIFDIHNLEKLPIGQDKKLIFTLAYFHKTYPKEALRMVKRLKLQYKEEPFRLKILNKIQAAIERRNSFFDITVYEEVLNVKVIYETDPSFSKSVEEKRYVKKNEY